MQKVYGGPSRLTHRGDVVSGDKKVKSAAALEKILFGTIVGFVGTSIAGVQNPSPNKLTFSAALSASNVVNGSITVKTIDSDNKEVTSTVSIDPITYASSHSATMTAIKAEIELKNPSLTATIDTNSITVTHSKNAVVILNGFAVTGGTAVTVAYDFDGTMLGVATKISSELNEDGTVYIKPTELCPYLTQGTVTVQPVDAMNMSSSLYAQFIEASGIARGEIRTSTVSGNAKAFSGLKPDDKVTALSLGNVEINLP